VESKTIQFHIRGIISVLVKKTHQELLREAVQDIIKKYQPQVQKKFSIQAG
jgi:ribosomal protein S17E